MLGVHEIIDTVDVCPHCLGGDCHEGQIPLGFPQLIANHPHRSGFYFASPRGLSSPVAVLTGPGRAITVRGSTGEPLTITSKWRWIA